MAQVVYDPATHEIEFAFEKGNFFRVILVDGIMGGVTPHGRIHMAVYNERQPIPRKVFHRVGDDGAVGDELLEKREGRSGIFREVEADLMFSYEVAVAMRGWLDEKIKQIENVPHITPHKGNITNAT